MTRIVLEQFAGEIPKIQPRYLPTQNGAVVSGCRLTRGDLAPMRADTLLNTLGASAASIYLHGSTWLSWGYDVDCVPGPVAADRLYLTRSTGAPQVYSGGVFYDLALPAPTGTITAALAAVTQKYAIPTSGAAARFTFNDGLWAQSATSIAVSVTKVRATAPVSQSLLVDTANAQRRLVAVLPKTPSVGQLVVISNKGTGYLTIHRNGKTIDTFADDMNLPAGDRTWALLFRGATWLPMVVPAAATIVEDFTPSPTTPLIYNAAVGANIAVNETATTTVNLPNNGGLLNIGDYVMVKRMNTGAVNVVGTAATINGAASRTIDAKDDRWIFVWTGTEWRGVRFDGAYGETYSPFIESSDVAANSAAEFLTTAAPKAVLVDLPTATTGQTTTIGAIGAHKAIVLPRGLNLDGSNGVYEISGIGDFFTFTFNVNWTVAASTWKAVRDDYAAQEGEVVIAYSGARRITVTLPDTGEDGDIIDVLRLGAKAVVVDNMAPDELAESVVYAYTWLTSLGEESAPSAGSNEVLLAPGRTVNLTMSAAAPAGRLITHRRIYRSATSASGVTDLYYIGQVTAATTTFADSLDNPIEEVLPSQNYDPPVATLRGLTAMPNGMMAGFSGQEVFFCEPYIPHAWPSRYSIKVNANIVGLVAFGSSLAVLTEGNPWVMQGLHPEAMAAQKIEVNFPCLAKRGIVDLGYAAVYPSVDGLVQIGADGSASLISGALWDREQWQALAPETFRCAQYIGRYAFSYDPDGLSRRLAFLDLSGELPFLIPVDSANYKDLIYHLKTGRLIGLDADGVSIRSIDPASGPFRTARWKSKPFLLTSYDTFSVAKIDADPPATGTPAFEFKVYADGALLHTITQPGAFMRLPAKLADEWQFEFLTNYTVTRAIIAGTADELLE